MSKTIPKALFSLVVGLVMFGCSQGTTKADDPPYQVFKPTPELTCVIWFSRSFSRMSDALSCVKSS